MRGASLDVAVSAGRASPGIQIENDLSLAVAILAPEHVASLWIDRSWTTVRSVSNQLSSETDRGLFHRRDASWIGVRQNTTSLS